MGLLAAGLARRGYLKPDRRLKRRLPRMIAAAAGMAALLWGIALGLEGPLEAGGVRIAALAALVAAGLVSYGGLALASGIVSVSEMRALLARRRDQEQGQG